MSHGGDGGIQPDGALALSDQEPQEHAKRRGAVLDCDLPAGTTLLENKRSQPAGIKAGWLLSKPPEQLANANVVLAEGPITRAALSMHPLTEGRQQGGIVNRGLERGQGDDPGISQVGQEQARTMDRSQLIRMAVVGAAASAQVALESRKGLLVQLTHRHAVPMGPIDELLRRSEMFASCKRGITCLR